MYEKYIKPYIIPVLVLLIVGGYAGYVLGGGGSSNVDSGRVQQISDELKQVRADLNRASTELQSIREGLTESRREITTVRREISESRGTVITVRERVEADSRLIEEARLLVGESQRDIAAIRKRNEIKSSQP